MKKVFPYPKPTYIDIKNKEGKVVIDKKSTIGYIFVSPRELGQTLKASKAQRARWAKIKYI